MLWSDFVEAVESHLAVEANRRGLEAFRARYMRNAVLDLQRYIRAYREANKTTYESTDLTEEGQAHLGTLPQGAIPKQFSIYSTDTDLTEECARYRLAYYPWNARQDMICGRLNFASWWAGWCCSTSGCPPTTLTADDQLAMFSKAYVYSVSPMGRDFLIYPQVTASTRLLLIFDGFFYDIDDADYVPFPEQASEAVAAYVMSRISRSVDKNLALAATYEMEWKQKRLELFRDAREVRDTNTEAEEYGATTVAP